MPHKKNPITCERISGLGRLMRGYTVAAMENIPLWHERDISHSSVERVILPDATTVLNYMLRAMTRVVSGLVVHPKRMRANLESTGGVVYSGQVLLALIRQGLSRRQAYELVQSCALKVWRNGGSFTEALQQDTAIRRHLSSAVLKRCSDPATHLRYVDKIFKRVGL